MPERSRKRPRDLNELARSIVVDATGEPKEPEDDVDQLPNSAVESGRRGGKIGGRARAKALTPERRSQIARKAAETRWARSNET